MHIKFAHLSHALAIGDSGTFARAAEKEGLTQPALSHSIASFERDYDLRLFDRGRGGVVATSAGSLVLESARQIVAAVQALDRSLRLFGEGETGRVSFGLGPHLASMLLPEVSGALLRSRPGLQIRPHIGTTQTLLDQLQDDKIEFILGHSWDIVMSPRIELEPLSSLRLAVLARRGHPLEGRKRLKLADLTAYPVASAVDLPASGAAGLGGGLICDNFHILRDVVEQTDCIWISSPPFVAEQLAAGRLVQLDVSDLVPSRIEIGMMSRRDRTKSPAAVSMIEEFRSALLRLEDNGA
jgi:DNA-binding transcriptional LysR family regulator